MLIFLVLFIQLIFLPKLLFLQFTKHKQILALQTVNFVFWIIFLQLLCFPPDLCPVDGFKFHNFTTLTLSLLPIFAFQYHPLFRAGRQHSIVHHHPLSSSSLRHSTRHSTRPVKLKTQKIDESTLF